MRYAARVRQRLIQIAKVAVAAILIYVLVSSGLIDARQLEGVRERWGWLLLAQLCFVCGISAAGVRWWVLLRAQAIPCTPRDVAQLVLIGWCFNQTMPSSTGGDVARALALAVDHPTRRHASLVSIAADRAIGLVMLLVVVIVGAIVNLELVRAQPVLTLAVTGVTAILSIVLAAVAVFYSQRTRAIARSALTRLRAAERTGSGPARGAADSSPSRAPSSEAAHPRRPRLVGRILHGLRSVATQIDEAAYTYRDHPRAILVAVIASTVLHAATIALNLCMTWALLGEPFAWRTLLLLVPLAHAMMAVGFTPGALGFTEGIYAWLLPLGGVPQGANIAVLQRLTWLAWAGVGAAVFAVRRGREGRVERTAELEVP